MDTIEKYMINVQPGSYGRNCRVNGRIQKCKSKPVFMVFVYDGEPKMSRLDSCCCAKHLPHAVRMAKKENVRILKGKKR